jgi:hypothetical protein
MGKKEEGQKQVKSSHYQEFPKINDNTEKPINHKDLLFSDEDKDLYFVKWSIVPCGYAKKGYTRKMFWMAHRLVAERKINRNLVYGEEIDHINGLRLDNRRINLRVTNRAGNSRNMHGFSTTRGVTWIKERRKWRATVPNSNSGKKYIFLGYFNSKEQCWDVVSKKRKELGFLT